MRKYTTKIIPMKDRELKLTNDRKNRMVLQRTSPKKQQSHICMWINQEEHLGSETD